MTAGRAKRGPDTTKAAGDQRWQGACVKALMGVQRPHCPPGALVGRGWAIPARCFSEWRARLAREAAWKLSKAPLGKGVLDEVRSAGT